MPLGGISRISTVNGTLMNFRIVPATRSSPLKNCSSILSIGSTRNDAASALSFAPSTRTSIVSQVMKRCMRGSRSEMSGSDQRAVGSRMANSSLTL